MLITVVATQLQMDELIRKGVGEHNRISWITDIHDIHHEKADVYIDLLFKKTQERMELLSARLPAPVIINSVSETLAGMQFPFFRMNGWNGFISRPVIEIAILNDSQLAIAEQLLNGFNWNFRIVPDIPGMIAARVVAMIINEAYFALEDQVSSKSEIDLAMKLGTNYPFGPFAWSEIIGLNEIAELLNTLSKIDKRYQPAPLLLQEAKTLPGSDGSI